jgi:hypothetical protein
MATSATASTQELRTASMPAPSSNGVPNRYALSGRERRQRHWWWVAALLVAIIVALVTYALAHNRESNRPVAHHSLGGSSPALVSYR